MLRSRDGSISDLGKQTEDDPSRKVPVQFAARVLTGALSGATLAAPQGSLVAGLIAGIIGAVIGTLGGAAFRTRLAAAFLKDRLTPHVNDWSCAGGSRGLGVLRQPVQPVQHPAQLCERLDFDLSHRVAAMDLSPWFR